MGMGWGCGSCHAAPGGAVGLKWVAAVTGLLGLQLAVAGERTEVPTRPGVTTTVFWQAARQVPAHGTVLLFPGGAGGFGPVQGGQPTGRNFLVRASDEFAARGYHVAIFGRPSDVDDLGYAYRATAPHLADVRAVLAAVKARWPEPVWLVGTSRGTVSATAAAVEGVGEIAGLVLSSSIVSVDKPGALPRQNLGAIRVPVLMLHHARDACRVTAPQAVPAVLARFTAAPVRKLMMVDGGHDPSGDPCEALHWHGFIGMEAEAVDRVTGWMDRPTP